MQEDPHVSLSLSLPTIYIYINQGELLHQPGTGVHFADLIDRAAIRAAVVSGPADMFMARFCPLVLLSIVS